jgi:uncharacterized membrane protein YidH (DUF202 family)
MAPTDQQPPVTDPANRTSLAWTRTGLAFAAIGAAMLKLSPVAGGVVLLLALPIWAVARRAAAQQGASTARVLQLVTATVVVVALAALVVALFGRSPDSLGQLLRAR